MSPEIIREDRFSIHIYGERGRHHLPHCHVRRRGGGAETVVSLALLEVLIGPELRSEERDALQANHERLNDEWQRLNS